MSQVSITMERDTHTALLVNFLRFIPDDGSDLWKDMHNAIRNAQPVQAGALEENTGLYLLNPVSRETVLNYLGFDAVLEPPTP